MRRVRAGRTLGLARRPPPGPPPPTHALSRPILAHQGNPCPSCLQGKNPQSASRLQYFFSSMTCFNTRRMYFNVCLRFMFSCLHRLSLICLFPVFYSFCFSLSLLHRVRSDEVGSAWICERLVFAFSCLRALFLRFLSLTACTPYVIMTMVGWCSLYMLVALRGGRSLFVSWGGFQGKSCFCNSSNSIISPSICSSFETRVAMQDVREHA